MNRREFFKGLAGSALVAQFLPLLPWPGQVKSAAPTVRLEGWLVLEKVVYTKGDLVRDYAPEKWRQFAFDTFLRYRGSPERIRDLANLFCQSAFADGLKWISHQPQIETIRDNDGFTHATIYLDESVLEVCLSGIWSFEAGPVAAGETGRKRTIVAGFPSAKIRVNS